MNEMLSKISKIMGPGLLFASTAIGVSHLIQSTRAGADFGLLIIGFVTNLLYIWKYLWEPSSHRSIDLTRSRSNPTFFS